MRSHPRVKIIHVHRDPAATCWSIYKSFFGYDLSKFSAELGSIIDYYDLYFDLMQFDEEIS